MAQTKKNTKSASNRSSTRSTTRSASHTPQKSPRRSHPILTQAAPYILAVFAAFFAVCIVFGEGWVGENVKNVITGLFAGAAYLLPVFILIRALLWKRDTEEGQCGGRTACLVTVYVLVTMLLHVLGGGSASFDVVTHYQNGQSLIGGGAFGGILGHLLFKAIGNTACLIIIIAAIVILALYVAGITPRGVFIFLAYKLKFAHEEREERRAALEEKRQNNPSKSQIKEEEYLAYLREKKQKQKENFVEDTTAYNKPETAINTEEPEVFHVKKKGFRKEFAKKNEEQEHIENSLGVMTSEEFSTDQEQLTLEDQPLPEEISESTENTSEQTTSERIDDEINRRTRERIGRSSGKDGSTLEIFANDSLDAVGVAMMNLKYGSGNDDSSSESDFDPNQLFVNAESAAMIDKLAAAHASSLEVQREPVSTPAPVKEEPKTSAPEYKFPPLDILTKDPGVTDDGVKSELQENAVKLVDTLKSFNVRTKIENISRGPTITRYELLPEPGTRVRSIVNLVDDIALNLATTGVRIEAPIPGKSAVGIEVPNKKRATVHLRTLIEDKQFRDAKSALTVCLGQNVAGENVYFDISKMPHLLIAGATGSGKSVCLNSIITSMLYKASPDDVKLILIDPKKVELTIYNGIPHLLVPVVSDPKKAAGSLSWAVSEMERRYGLIEAVGVRDINSYNNVTKDDPGYEYMPKIVIVIDELADLMMTAPDDVEESICRIAQKARAAGMYLVIGTQRPSVDVITGLIKANIPSRIACRTSSQIDSRTIIDIGSAANLIGMGDMLFNPVGALKPIRVQGAYVSDEDVEEVVTYIKTCNAGAETYSDEIANQIEREAQRCGVKKGSAADLDGGDGTEDEDPMLKAAIELAIESGKISTSLIQRRLSLGYGRAAKLIDRMEQLGYVSAPDGQKPREVLITKQDYMEMRLKEETPFD